MAVSKFPLGTRERAGALEARASWAVMMAPSSRQGCSSFCSSLSSWKEVVKGGQAAFISVKWSEMSEATHRKQIVRNIRDLKWSLQGWERSRQKGHRVLLCHSSSLSSMLCRAYLSPLWRRHPCFLLWQSSFSRRVGQALHRGMAWFQQALVVPACPGCMDTAPWPTASRFPMFSHPTSQPLRPSLHLCQLLLRAVRGSHLCCAAGTLHGLAFSRGYGTSSNTLACLGRHHLGTPFLGWHHKHFSSPPPTVQVGWRFVLPQSPCGRGRTESGLEKWNVWEKPQPKPKTAPSRLSRDVKLCPWVCTEMLLSLRWCGASVVGLSCVEDGEGGKSCSSLSFATS